MNRDVKKKTKQFLKIYTKILIWSFFIIIIMNMIIITQQNVCYEVITTNSMVISNITGLNPSENGCIPVNNAELQAKKSFYQRKMLIGTICLVGIISLGLYDNLHKKERCKNEI